MEDNDDITDDPTETLPSIDPSRLVALVRRANANGTRKTKIESMPHDPPTDAEYAVLIPHVESLIGFRTLRLQVVKDVRTKLPYRAVNWIDRWVGHMHRYGWPSGVNATKL